jgi:hypothetical protein
MAKILYLYIVLIIMMDGCKIIHNHPRSVKKEVLILMNKNAGFEQYLRL